jgi:hypothetical protein
MTRGELVPISRIKTLVLALFALYWLAVVLILVADRPVFDQVGGLPTHGLFADIGAVLVLTALLSVLSAGVVRGWRWTFWLILIVFVLGIRTVPVAVLEFTGRLPQQGPTWFVLFTVVVGLAQLGTGVVMLAGWRRSGAWGDWGRQRAGGGRGES